MHIEEVYHFFLTVLLVHVITKPQKHHTCDLLSFNNIVKILISKKNTKSKDLFFDGERFSRKLQLSVHVLWRLFNVTNATQALAANTHMFDVQ